MNWGLVSQNMMVKGKENVFVDLGAQVGTYSEFFYINYHDAIKQLISVEPHPENTRKIHERIARHNAQEKWLVDECAVSISDGEQVFTYLRTEMGEPLGSFNLEDALRQKDYDSHEEEFYHDLDKKLERRMVKLKTMRQICPHPNIIKIDIEGYEYPLLPEILRMPSVYALIIEFGQMPTPAREKEGYLLEDYLHWLDYKGFTDLCGQTDQKDGYAYFIPKLPATTRWEDIPPFPHNRCFHVLAQKHEGIRMLRFKG